MPLPLVGSYDEAMNYFDDADFYRWDVTQTGRLTVYSSGNLDLIGAVFDPTGEIIAIDVDAGQGENFKVQPGILSPGTCILLVSALYRGDLGPYRLTSEFEPVAGAVPMSARLAHLSVLTGAGGTSGFPVLGFVTADAAKSLLIRAVGRGLSDFGVTDYLRDPILTLFDASSTELDGNDD